MILPISGKKHQPYHFHIHTLGEKAIRRNPSLKQGYGPSANQNQDLSMNRNLLPLFLRPACIAVLTAVFILLLVLPASASSNPFMHAGEITPADEGVPVSGTRVQLSGTSDVALNGAAYTHRIGRVSLVMIPLISGLNSTPAVQGNTVTDGNYNVVHYAFYPSLIKEHVTLYRPEPVQYTYEIRLSDWVTTEPDRSRPVIVSDAAGNRQVTYPHIREVTNYARDSTTDIRKDAWGNLVVMVNRADIVVLPRPFAVDAAGKRFDLAFDLDKAAKTISITGEMPDALYPVTVDPSERVTNGGFETGTIDGWQRSSPLPSLSIISDGAYSGTYYCEYRGHGSLGYEGYSRIYQDIDYTGVDTVSMAVRVPRYNKYDFVLSDGFYGESANNTANYMINFPGQEETGWIVKSAQPTLTGTHPIQFWTYGYNVAFIDAISATGPPPGILDQILQVFHDLDRTGSSFIRNLLKM